MDWAHSVLVWAQAIFDLAVPILTGWLGTALIAYLQKKHINTTVVEAVTRAAGAAFAYAKTNGKNLKDPTVFAEAVRVGVAYLESRVPEALSKAGVVGFEKDKMVGAELGKQMAISGEANAEAVSAPVEAPSPLPTAVHASGLSILMSDDSVEKLALTIAARLRAAVTTAAS